MISSEILNRKGARSSKQVPKDILDLLSHGQIESVNLMEGLAIDMQKLYTQIDLPTLNWNDIEPHGWLKKMKLVPEQLYQCSQYEFLEPLQSHLSDTFRCWAAGLIAYDDLPIQERLDKMKSFADDPHFGVREMAWIYVRDHIIENLDDSIAYVSKWVLDDSSNIRRFAIEATRPRGVWCAHITALKEDPQKAFHLLEPLKNDPSKYVQDSVANWLNDASKTHPEWVEDICREWQKTSNTKATMYICKRALRSLKK